MTAIRRKIGRIKVPVIINTGNKEKAVVMTLGAKVRRDTGGPRLKIRGPVQLEPEIVQHLHETVLVFFDLFISELSRTGRGMCFELSFVNLGVAAVYRSKLTITGFSADLGILLALISAALKIPIPEDLVVTGHIADLEGAVRAVHGILAKVTAAGQDKQVQRFIGPDFDADPSLKILSPEQRQEAQEAMFQVKGRLNVVTVKGIDEVYRLVFPESAVVMVSLEGDFFETHPTLETEDSPLVRAVAYFTQDNPSRFWKVLEEAVLHARTEEIKRLLSARIHYQVRCKRYPNDFGRRVFSMMRSLPPMIRRTCQDVPFLEKRDYDRFFLLAGESDLEDLYYLLAALTKKVELPSPDPVEKSPPTPTSDAGWEDAVERVLRELSQEALAQTIGLPIDMARAGFVLTEVTTNSYDEFFATVVSFFLKLLRVVGAEPTQVDSQVIGPMAAALADRAFKDQGGIRAAFAQVRDGVEGGMQGFLDRFTDQFKAEHRMNHVQAVLRRAIDQLDWNQRLGFTAALMKRLEPILPPEIRSQPFARYVNSVELIVEAYVRSQDRMKEMFRRI
jgi:hypothetical protein